MTRTLLVPYWRGSSDLPAYSQDAYGPEDVLRLRDQAARHVSDLNFLCLTNETVPGVECVPFMGHDVGGWTKKCEAWRPDLWPEARNERIVLCDLDTCFVGPAGWLWEWNLSPVGMPLDPYQAPRPFSGIYTWDREGASLCWDAFKAAGKMLEFLYAGVPCEMSLLRALYDEHSWRPLESEPKRIRSLKVHGYDPEKHPDCSVVVLHGKPKPRDLAPDHPVIVA